MPAVASGTPTDPRMGWAILVGSWRHARVRDVLDRGPCTRRRILSVDCNTLDFSRPHRARECDFSLRSVNATHGDPIGGLRDDRVDIRVRKVSRVRGRLARGCTEVDRRLGCYRRTHIRTGVSQDMFFETARWIVLGVEPETLSEDRPRRTRVAAEHHSASRGVGYNDRPVGRAGTSPW